MIAIGHTVSGVGVVTESQTAEGVTTYSASTHGPPADCATSESENRGRQTAKGDAAEGQTANRHHTDGDPSDGKQPSRTSANGDHCVWMGAHCDDRHPSDPHLGVVFPRAVQINGGPWPRQGHEAEQEKKIQTPKPTKPGLRRFRRNAWLWHTLLKPFHPRASGACIRTSQHGTPPGSDYAPASSCWRRSDS